MNWSKIGTFASVLSLPASVGLYVGWVVYYGPKLMSVEMLVVAVLFLLFFGMLAATTVSVFRLVYQSPSNGSRFPVSGVDRQVDIARASYIGRVTVDVQYLARDYYLQVTVTGFNGAGIPLVIGGLDGSIRYREVVNGQSLDRGLLPVPSIENRASHNLNPGPYSEFWIVLEQRLPGALAGQMSRFLSSKGIVQLDFSSLSIWVAPRDRPQDRHRLSTWDGVTLQQRDGMVVVGKLINVSISERDSASEREPVAELGLTPRALACDFSLDAPAVPAGLPGEENDEDDRHHDQNFR